MKGLKDIAKLVVTHFFIITVGVLFITSLSNLIEGNKTIPSELPWQIILTGIIGAVPSFIFYFKKEPTKKQFRIRCIIHFIVIETLVMTEGALFCWYEEFLEAMVMFSIILLIYIFVWVYSYLMNLTLANDINNALKRINENED